MIIIKINMKVMRIMVMKVKLITNIILLKVINAIMIIMIRMIVTIALSQDMTSSIDKITNSEKKTLCIQPSQIFSFFL